MAYKQSPFPMIAGTSPVKSLGRLKKGFNIAKKIVQKAKNVYTKYKRGKPISISTERNASGNVVKKTVDYKNPKYTQRTFYNTSAKTATKKPNLQHLTTETGTADKMGVTSRVTTYQDINNPGKLTQIRSSDVGIKGGDFRIYPADKVKLNKMGY